MILQKINSSIAIDEIVVENSENYVHFLTHIDKVLSVPKDWKSIIYTSSHIFKFLWLKVNPINQRYFRILQYDECASIQLPNNVEIKVTMFEICSITGNVAFHFKESEKNALYVGPFGMCQEMLLNSRFQQYIKSKIQLLYLDNTRCNCVVETSENFVAEKLEKILREHPGYQILLHIPPYGYEELILKLLVQFEFKICASAIILEIFKKFDLPVEFETNIKQAQIILGEECITVEKIKRRFKQKLLNVRIIESNNQLINYDLKSIGLYQINWSPHPSLFQLHSLVSFIRPQYVEEIYHNLPKLPEILHNLCLRKRKINTIITNEPSNCGMIIQNRDNANENDDNRHSNCNTTTTTTDKESSNIKIKLSESVLEKNRERNDDTNNDEQPDKNIFLSATEAKIPIIINCPVNDPDEIITISSTDSEKDYHQQRIKLPRRRNKGTNRYHNRIVGIVTPMRASQDNNVSINFTELNQLQNTQNPDVNNTNTTEEDNNLVENEEENDSQIIDINDYLNGDCETMSIPSADLNKSILNESISQNEQSTTINKNVTNDNCNRNNDNDNNKKRSIIKTHSNLIHKKLRVRFEVKCKQLIYDDDDSS